MNDATKKKAPDIHIKGGTGTSKSETLYEERFQEGEEARDIARAEHELSKNQQEIDNPLTGKKLLMPGSMDGAVMATNRFTDNPDVPQAHVGIWIVNRHGQPTGELCLADVIVGTNENDPFDRALIIVCPHCQEHSHKHQQDNQMRILNSQTPFHLEEGAGPPEIQYPDPETGLMLVYKSAGIITESASFTCYDCGTRYRIDNNRLWPD